MKNFIFFIYAVFFILELQAQNSAYIFKNESIKYWYYRDRLKYFVYPGTEEGNSVIMTKRNDWGQESGDPEWDWVDQYNGVAWGQTHKINGYYIGMLATEYKLLKDNEQILKIK